MALSAKQLHKKYPEYRDEMAPERERELVSDLFDFYEAEGFAKAFWSVGGDFLDHIGKPFTVVGRVHEYDEEHPDGTDLSDLPMWKIRFADSSELVVYPDEVIPSQMRDAGGCPEEYL